MRMRLFFGILISGLLLTSLFNNCGKVGDSAVFVDTDFVPDPEVGEQVYKTTSSPTCISCHGANGMLEPSVDLKSYDDTTISTAIRVGPNTMPIYSTSDLSDRNIAHLIAYIRTL
jgi:mono/diheme cytochrome c family protein